jgi:sugar phosphate isomerase/epimerase
VYPLPGLEGPEDPRERVEAIVASLERLAPFGPTGIVCLTGRGDRRTIVDGLTEIGATAERLGLRIALEPYQRDLGGDAWSIVHTLGEAADLIDEVGSPALGIQFDVWHLWNTPDLFEEIEAHAGRLAGVHVDDWREPTRGWADRALPGDGAAGVPAILAALDDAGWDGYYDLEIFSDNGAFGTAYEDSFWDLDPLALATRARERFEDCWRARHA